MLSKKCLSRREAASEDLFATLLRQCGDVKEGRKLQLRLTEAGYGNSRYLGNLLVQMYGKCGSVDDARSVFLGLNERNVISWNLFVSALYKNGQLPEAKMVFEKIPQRNPVTWSNIMNAYAQSGHPEQVWKLFVQIPEQNVVLWTIMFEAYAKERHLQEAKGVFSKMPEWNVVCLTAMLVTHAEAGNLEVACDMFEGMMERNVVSWNAMVTGHANNGHLHKARSVYDRMPAWDSVSTTAMGTAYAQHNHVQNAEEILSRLSVQSVVSCTAMITAYAENKQLEEAKALFDKMPGWNVVSWTAICTGYARNGQVEIANSLFKKMPKRDVVAWNAMVSAYACEYPEQAKQTFDEMPHKNQISLNTMITAFGINGQLQEAKDMFDGTLNRDSQTWTSIIQAYNENGQSKLALVLFKLMDLDGAHQDKLSLMTALDVCASAPSLVDGRLIHHDILQTPYKSDMLLNSALVNMYGKCGSLIEARHLFDTMPVRDFITWNAIITAYSQTGRTNAATKVFRAMVLDGVDPVYVTFVSMVGGFSHAGLMQVGRDWFVAMQGDYGVVPTHENFKVMVDLLGRCGHLVEAEDLIRTMPYTADVVDWRTLLGACKMHGDLKRGEYATKCASQANPQCASPYVLLSSILKCNPPALLAH